MSPIRSDHGRNAVIRQLATWPLISPWHGLATVVGVLVVAIGVASASSALAGPPQHGLIASQTSVLTEVATTTATTTPVTGQALPGMTGSATVVSSSASGPAAPSTSAVMAGNPVVAAQTFAALWVQHNVSQAQWLGKLQPLCTDEYGRVVLPTVDPSTVPANAVTGPATLTRGSVRAAEVSVPLDKLVIVVHLQDVTGQGDWRVSDVEPV